MDPDDLLDSTVEAGAGGGVCSPTLKTGVADDTDIF